MGVADCANRSTIDGSPLQQGPSASQSRSFPPSGRSVPGCGSQINVITVTRFASCTKVKDTRCVERRVDYSQHTAAYFGMVTRQERIDSFDHEGTPPPDQPLQILCEDHVGTYVIPFPCQWHGDAWRSVATNRRIEATVIGWRAPNKFSAEP